MSLNQSLLLLFDVARLKQVSTVFERTEKTLFNIASEASYVYILKDKSWSKMPKMVQFGEFLKT